MLASMRPNAPHDPSVEAGEELSDVCPLVILAPTPQLRVQLVYHLLGSDRRASAGKLAHLILETPNRFPVRWLAGGSSSQHVQHGPQGRDIHASADAQPLARRQNHFQDRLRRALLSSIRLTTEGPKQTARRLVVLTKCSTISVLCPNQSLRHGRRSVILAEPASARR